jgi:hypothetical protein
LGRCLSTLPGRLSTSKRLFELRQDGEEVADEAVGDLEDRRLFVIVDGAAATRNEISLRPEKVADVFYILSKN